MKTYIYAGVALGVILLLAMAYWKGRVDESANTLIAEARIADMGLLIDAQNEAIAQMRIEAQKRQREAKKALHAAQANTAKNRQAIAETLALQPQGDECKAAEALLGTIK